MSLGWPPTQRRRRLAQRSTCAPCAPPAPARCLRLENIERDGAVLGTTLVVKGSLKWAGPGMPAEVISAGSAGADFGTGMVSGVVVGRGLCRARSAGRAGDCACMGHMQPALASACQASLIAVTCEHHPAVTVPLL